MMQPTTARVCLDTAETARFTASAASTSRLECLPGLQRDLSLPKTPKRGILASEPPGIRGMAAKLRNKAGVRRLGLSLQL
jgi:hypothetical protein